MLPPIFRSPAGPDAPAGPAVSGVPAAGKPFFAPDKKDATFHLALTMAGTVSAAAYTAGVVDFFIEAMDAWEEAKRDDEDKKTNPPKMPNHRVVLHAISGTSGGGITAAITAATLFRDFAGMRGEASPSAQDLPAARNRLYDTWVRAITIEKLLAIDDLPRGEKPRSLLNSRAIDTIAEQVLDMAPADPARPRRWVAPTLHLFITSANLRGIPYRIQFTGTTGLGYPMLGHFNYQHFLVTASAPAADWLIHLDPGAIKGEPLDPQEEGKRLGWPALVDAARATSAFPMGFAARRLGHSRTFYSEVQWHYADQDLKLASAKVEPDWYIDFDRKPPDERIEFLNVDGGAINNEPFELARVALSGVDGRNPRDALEADRAVIMIDPLFRPDPGYDPVDNTGKPVTVNGEPLRGRIRRRDDRSIFAVASSLLATFVANARFKPDELGLAADETVFSRFLVAPRAPVAKDRYDRYPIFGELMGAFAAFLHRDLRHYDYRLGRENARAFLLRWFALPEHNPLFKKWPEAKREEWLVQYAVRDDDGRVVLIQKFVEGAPHGEPQRLVPIIPLVGALQDKIEIADRRDLLRHINFDYHEFDIGRRLDALFDTVKHEAGAGSGWLKRQGINAVLGAVWPWLRGKAMEPLRQAFATGRLQAEEKVQTAVTKTVRPAATQRKIRNGWHRV